MARCEPSPAAHATGWLHVIGLGRATQALPDLFIAEGGRLLLPALRGSVAPASLGLPASDVSEQDSTVLRSAWRKK